MIVDTKCWRGIAADFSEMPSGLRLINAPGRFNKFADITGRILWSNDGHSYPDMWLHLTNITNVRMKPFKTEAAERIFFDKMLREKNAYFGARAAIEGVAHQ